MRTLGILLVCWTYLAIQTWGGPSWEFIGSVGEAGSTLQPQIYLDVSNGNNYIYWEVEGQFCYRKYNVDNKPLTSRICLDFEHPIQSSYLSGKGDGKTLYLVIAGRRVYDGRYCSKNHENSGCFDVYYMESLDDGKTWSDPVQTPRPDMEDYYHRTNVHIVYVPLTGRIFVLYGLYDDHRSVSLAYITKPINSSVFANEQFIDKTSDCFSNYCQWSGIKMYLSQGSTHNVLHVLARFSSIDFNKFYYFRSINNGVHWDNKELIKTEHLMRCDSSYEAALNKDLIFAACGEYANYHNLLKLAWTSNQGLTWSYENLLSDNSGVRLASVSIVPDLKAKNVSFMIPVQTKPPQTVLYHFATKQWDDVGEPPTQNFDAQAGASLFVTRKKKYAVRYVIFNKASIDMSIFHPDP